MTTPGSFPDGERLPADISVSAFESTAHRILRDEYDQATALNRAAIDHFNPDAPTARFEVLHGHGAFEEATTAEEQFANTLYRGMVKELGLKFEFLSPDDPNLLVQHAFNDDSLEQIRLIERADGAKIPLRTIQGPRDEEGRRTEWLQLVSHDRAKEHVERISTKAAEEACDIRLETEFDMTPEFIALSEMSLEDKRGMLAAHDALARAHVPMHPDSRELDAERQALVAAMLPKSGRRKEADDKKFAELAKQYTEHLEQLVRRFEMDPVEAHRFQAVEQFARLRALNGQLLGREQRQTLYGATMASLATGIVGGAGAFEANTTHILSSNPVLSAALGVTVTGAMFGREQVDKYRSKKEQSRQGFVPLQDDAAKHLSIQLQDERKLAAAYRHIWSDNFVPARKPRKHRDR